MVKFPCSSFWRDDVTLVTSSCRRLCPSLSVLIHLSLIRKRTEFLLSYKIEKKTEKEGTFIETPITIRGRSISLERISFVFLSLPFSSSFFLICLLILFLTLISPSLSALSKNSARISKNDGRIARSIVPYRAVFSFHRRKRYAAILRTTNIRRRASMSRVKSASSMSSSSNVVSGFLKWQ